MTLILIFFLGLLIWLFENGVGVGTGIFFGFSG